MKPTEFRCDQCEKSFIEDQMTATGGDEIYCQTCWAEKVEELRRQGKTADMFKAMFGQAL